MLLFYIRQIRKVKFSYCFCYFFVYIYNLKYNQATKGNNLCYYVILNKSGYINLVVVFVFFLYIPLTNFKQPFFLAPPSIISSGWSVTVVRELVGGVTCRPVGMWFQYLKFLSSLPSQKKTRSKFYIPV